MGEEQKGDREDPVEEATTRVEEEGESTEDGDRDRDPELLRLGGEVVVDVTLGQQLQVDQTGDGEAGGGDGEVDEKLSGGEAPEAGEGAEKELKELGELDVDAPVEGQDKGEKPSELKEGQRESDAGHDGQVELSLEGEEKSGDVVVADHAAAREGNEACREAGDDRSEEHRCHEAVEQFETDELGQAVPQAFADRERPSELCHALYGMEHPTNGEAIPNQVSTVPD